MVVNARNSLPFASQESDLYGGSGADGDVTLDTNTSTKALLQGLTNFATQRAQQPSGDLQSRL